MRERKRDTERCAYWPFTDLSDFDEIADLAADVVMSDYREKNLDLSPAEAVAAIRRFDLSSFDWCPKNEEEFRFFLGRYMPFQVLQSFMQFHTVDYDSFMRAWSPDSEWCPIFMRMMALVRHGAFQAYEEILAEEAVVEKRRKRAAAKATREKAPVGKSQQFDGVETLQ